MLLTEVINNVRQQTMAYMRLGLPAPTIVLINESLKKPLCDEAKLHVTGLDLPISEIMGLKIQWSNTVAKNEVLVVPNVPTRFLPDFLKFE